MKNQFGIWIMAAALALAGCSSTPDQPEDTSAYDQESMGQSGGLDGQGVSDRELGQANALSQAEQRDAALRQQLTVYFDYDSSQIRADFLPVLDAHARYLRDNPGARIRLEGHTDERGTREYNIALGERRGEAVRRALLLRGAARAQLLVVSYGEEQPAVLGSGETAWAKNRRVVMVYQ
ncbi:OmpA/MotB domain-containing protein [Oceanococcus atlanticus]|uniref:Peptidoglycan-associated lipoprotein n=1 Tax=Oceanococcus atlanticus TaxID=1317117 RepID=A0A1Y1SCB8_9GAMM|nr:peptidoglycan-associated lipoprotein Pal [Oceanococcus atlanticus]ORE86272.1 OmpA/MotB domain-containing protein [Oceanococcus atlanticus]